MGRLDNIIARNRQANRPSERLVVSFVVGFIVLLILALAVFTDLGVPPDPRAEHPPAAVPTAPATPTGPATPGQHGKTLDGVLLRRSPK